MHEERMFQILDAAIREFIDSGEPVSSQVLFRNYDFGIRPAMIRSELCRLTEEGFLEQPYHSAGRVPSNKGYEFFASQALAGRKPEHLREDLMEPLAGGEVSEFILALSEELGLAAAAGTERGEVVKDGLQTLMEHLAWTSRDEVLQVVRDFEALDERVRGLGERFGGDFLNVFIGRKSPVTKSNELAIWAGDYNLGGERFYLLAIGPKRMNYEKAASIFKGLKKIAE